MVTLIVGRRKDDQTSTVASIATYCDGADDPKRIEFDLKRLEPGAPK